MMGGHLLLAAVYLILGILCRMQSRGMPERALRFRFMASVCFGAAVGILFVVAWVVTQTT